MRALARNLNLDRKTIERKLLFLGEQAKISLHKQLMNRPPCEIFEFDDLETAEHSKCKPLSVTLAVEYKTRRILGFSVSQMPAKGLLVKKARKLYGVRKDFRGAGRAELFARLQPFVHPHALIKSDSNPHYPADVKKYFPHAVHQTFVGRRGSIGGQGELKKVGFDPLFSLNHTCAMMRANMSRLIRKTWCLTRKAKNLEAHLYVYAWFHNQRLKLPPAAG